MGVVTRPQALAALFPEGVHGIGAVLMRATVARVDADHAVDRTDVEALRVRDPKGLSKSPLFSCGCAHGALITGRQFGIDAVLGAAGEGACDG